MFDQFVRQNRWWTDPTSLKSDRHLRRLTEAPLRWLPPLPFRFDRDAIYTLRGPRQVGKSTILKRQIAQLLSEGWPARAIMYLDVELAGLTDARDLTAAIRAYVDDARAAHARTVRLAILLDEVTRVSNWAGAVRGLVDNGELDDVTVIATGSHTTDLKHGGERLPGRRGGGADLDAYLLPLAFREYVQLLRPDLTLPSTLPALDDLQAIAASSLDRTAVRPVLIPLFARYLRTGGYLTVINAAHAEDMVRAEIYEQYREALVGEFTRAALRESYVREVVAWLSGHLGQEFTPGDMAKETDIGSKDTARHYVEHLENTYAVLQSYRTSSLTCPKPAFRAPRKVHPIDPFIFHLLRAWAAADPDPWTAACTCLDHPDDVGHLVESTVMVHLYRAFGDRVYYWRPDRGKEIDAVIHSGHRLHLLEVKYRQRVGRHDVEELARAGGGLVLSRDENGFLDDGTMYQLPAAEFLACLDTPALTTARHPSTRFVGDAPVV